ncbi:MAG TPA: LytR C-terminal domain-containing protein [Nocardioides sp.]|nr:LytR C-terminal domain-containing protein [Nocardioides sp.]
MRDGARTTATLAVLFCILLLAAVWGWSALTDPFPGKADLPTCVATSVPEGEKVYPDQVVVSVFNAGTREGLAGRTMQLFTDQGFVEGDSGNAPSNARVSTAEIWTDDPTSPAVLLIASRLGPNAKIVRRDTTGAGVVVIVGDAFKDLREGRKSVKATEDSEICSPPVT